MNLDDAQKQQVARWIEQGLKLSEIQHKLMVELGIGMTYMEMRVLMSELQLKPKDVPVNEPIAKPLASKAGPAEAAPGNPAAVNKLAEDDDVSDAPPMGNVSITVDQVTRPGSLASGKVTFGDGNKGEWYLDQYGRLGLAAEKKGYKPSPDDLMAFQAELQNVLSGM
jgi:hypothetical protein